MTEEITLLFKEMGIWSIPVGMMLNVLLNLIGFVPSVIVTTANVLLWGPWFGGFLSWLGEVIGSCLAFYLYRAGIHTLKTERHQQWEWLNSLNRLTRMRQLVALISIRVTPFVPSGLINLVGALTTISFPIFLVATLLGKIPSIALEVWIGYGVAHIKENHMQLILAVSSLLLLAVIFRGRSTATK